jgi:hypothetical protein
MNLAEEYYRAKRILMPRTEDAKQRRREINRGSFPCSYCDRPPFQHRLSFRRHVIIVHHMNCLWNGIVRPFETEEHKVRVLIAVHRGGRHPSNRSGGTTTQQVGISNSRLPAIAYRRASLCRRCLKCFVRILSVY